jgi:phosphoserine phosphatase
MGSLTKPRGRRGERYRVVCVDLDGTLIPATSVSMFLGARLGQAELLRDLERLFMETKISNREIAERSAPAYRGKALVEIADLLSEIPVVSGVEAFVNRLKRSEIRVVLCTITWRFAARAFQRRYGFDACCGTEMEERDGVLTGSVSRHFNELDKLQFARDYCSMNDVPMEECAAIGDSRSDIPLFQHVGLAIAFNGSEAARFAAHVSVDSQDICDVLKYLAPEP